MLVCVINRGFLTSLSWFYRMIWELHALKSLELKFDLSSEFLNVSKK